MYYHMQAIAQSLNLYIHAYNFAADSHFPLSCMVKCIVLRLFDAQALIEICLQN